MAKKSISPKKSSNQESDITNLPFVKSQKGGNCFWSVQPTGDYAEDCVTGHRYAVLAIEYMKKDNLGILLPWCVRDMPKGKDSSGIEVGFLSFVGKVLSRCDQNVVSSVLAQWELFSQKMKFKMPIEGLSYRK